jgi:hypothetical protein
MYPFAQINDIVLKDWNIIQKTKMKKSYLIFLFMISTLVVTAQKNKVNNQWLVILAGSETYELAAQVQDEFQFDTQLLYSGDYDNLNPGWYINCLPFDKYQAAQQRSRALKNKGVDNYVKYSGAFMDTKDYLLDHHYLVYRNKYLITDHQIELSQIEEITGYERGNQYMGKATIKESILPVHIRQLLNKEVLVYDFNGNRKVAKVNGFLAVNIIVPHFGTVANWGEHESQGTKKSITNFLFEKEKPFIVATLEIEEGFQGVIAHLKGSQEFMPYQEIKDSLLEEQAFDHFFQSTEAQENETLLKEAVQNESNETYQILKQAKTYQIGNAKIVYFSVGYGEFGPVQFHSTIMGTWEPATEQLTIWYSDSENLKPDFSPLIIGAGNDYILGVYLKSNETYFNYSGSDNYKSLIINNYDCGF